MSRKITILIITVLLLAACAAPAVPLPTATSAPTPTPAPLVFTDGLGRTVTLAQPAQRIVSLAPSNTEILFAIGAGKQVVGRDDFSDYPPEAKDIAPIGGNMGKYNNEAIVSLKPDLVLAAEINTPEQVQALEAVGVPVYYLSNPKDLDGLYQNLATVAKMTGHTPDTAPLIGTLKGRVEAVRAKIAALSYAPTVYYELDATNPSAPYTAGPGTYVDLLVSMAGGINIGNSLGTPWAQISAEKLIELNPVIILLGDAAYGTTPDAVKARPGWAGIDAVKNNQIFAFDDNLVSRPGPRLVDGLEALAKALHPALFK